MTADFLRVLALGGEGAHHAEGGQAQLAQVCLGAPGDHHVGSGPADDLQCFPYHLIAWVAAAQAVVMVLIYPLAPNRMLTLEAAMFSSVLVT